MRGRGPRRCVSPRERPSRRSRAVADPHFARGLQASDRRLHMRSQKMEWQSKTLEISGDRLQANIGDISAHVGRFKSTVGRLIQISGTVYTRIEGLAHSILGRRRTLIKGDDSIRAQDISIRAQKDVRANGKHIRLG